ncbi:hypothetical protein [Micromonospora sp. NPDC048169]|uniref:hypothetical protein n=1 Tax=unclassified Micromonospora TaxID=2617518 RepID=UPI0033C0593F
MSVAISVFAAILSVVSLGISVLIYGRQRTRLGVRVGWAVGRYPDGTLTRGLQFEVANDGPAAVQISSIVLRAGSTLGSSMSGGLMIGPDLPVTIEGHHSQSWTLFVPSMLASMTERDMLSRQFKVSVYHDGGQPAMLRFSGYDFGADLRKYKEMTAKHGSPPTVELT